MRLLLTAVLVVALPAAANAQSEVDFTAYAISGPAEAEAGEDIILSLEVGSRDLSPFAYAVIFRSSDEASTLVASGSLDLDEMVEFLDLPVTVPADLAGRQEVLLQLDPGNAVEESNEFDNEVSSVDPLRIRPRLGDLFVERISGPGGRVQIGAPLEAEVEVRNLGTNQVQGSLRLVLSRGTALSAEDARLTQQSVDLQPGASRILTLSGPVPPEVGTGRRFLGAFFLPSGNGDRDPFNDVAVAEETVVVVADGLEWATASLPRAVLGFSYLALLEATGGDGSFAYQVVDGELPPGITLEMGALSGVAEASGTFPVTLEVSSDGRSVERSFQLEVAAVDEELLVVTDELPVGRLRSVYEQQLIATGGEPPYVWSSVGDPPPDGLSLDADGRLAGTPAQVGVFPVRFRVEERTGSALEVDLFLRIETSASILVDPEPLPLATAGETYDEQIGVTGGNPPYQWRLGATPLPPGLTLSSSGRLEGRPSLTGNFVFQVQVEDSSSPPLTDRSLVFLTVEDAANFTIVVPSPEPVQFRNPFERVFEAEGGVAPYQWRLVPGTVLPGNVVFSNGEAEQNQTNDGVLRGAPTGVGAYGLGIRVEDAAGRRREVGTVLAVQRSAPNQAEGGCQSVGASAPWLLVMLAPWMGSRRRRS